MDIKNELIKRRIEELRNLTGVKKEVGSADVPGLLLTREDLGVRLPKSPKKSIEELRDAIGKNKGFVKGGAGSGSWEGPGQPRFAHTPAEKEGYRFKESDAKWKEYTKPVYAIQMKDGSVYADPKAAHHADVMESAGLDPDKIVDGGFIIDGKFAGHRSDSVERLIAQREPKDKPNKTEKAERPVWQPSAETMSEATIRDTGTNAPPTRPDTREGHKPLKDEEPAPKKKDGRALYGQKHQEPIKNPGITPPAGMGMVSDGFRTGDYE